MFQSAWPASWSPRHSGLAPTAGSLIAAQVLQGLFGSLIDPQTSVWCRRGSAAPTAAGPRRPGYDGRSRQRRRAARRRRSDRARQPDPRVAARLARRRAGGDRRARPLAEVPPGDDGTTHHRLDVLGPPSSAARRSASSSRAWCTTRSTTSDSPGWRSKRRPRRPVPRWGAPAEPRPTATAGRHATVPATVVRLRDRPGSRLLPGVAGLPLVLALYYQRGLGYTALRSELGSRPTPLEAISRPLTGRVVTRIGRPLVVAGAVPSAWVGWRSPWWRRTCRGARDLGARRTPVRDGLRPGGGDHPTRRWQLMDVDPRMGSTAGWCAADRAADRAGDRPGPDRCGLLQLVDRDEPRRLKHALGNAVIAAICFVSIAVAIGVHDLVRARRRESLV